MRFARYLEENAQPEWSRAYLQYRSLKKLIKRVDARHRARLARSNALSRQNSNNSSIGFASARNVTEGLRRRVRGESFSFKQSGRANSENGNTHNQKHREASSVEVDGETGEPAHRDLESGTDWHGDTGAEAGPSRNLSPHGHGAGAEATTGLQPHDKASGIRFASLLQLSRQDAEDDEMDAAADALPPVSLVGTGLHIDPEATAIPLRPRPSRACDRSSPSQATPAPSGGTRPEGHGSSRTPKHSHSTGADSDETRIEEIGRKVTAFVEGNSNGKSRRNGATHADEPTRDDAVHPPTTRNGIPSDDPAIASASVKDRTPKRKDKWDKAKKGQKKASGTNKTFLSIVEDNFDWEERIFFAVLDTELTRIVNFYEERESEYAARFELIAMQLRELSDHRRNFKAREEEERSLLNAVADTAMSKLNNIITVGGAAAAAHGRASQETGAKRRATAGAAAPSSPVPAPAEIDSGARDEGDRRRAIALANIPPDVAARILGDHEASRRENRAAALSQDPERYKYARKKLKTAVLEIYRGLEILKNYGILNRTGFAKILKKAEKTWEVPVADAYFQARVAPSILVTSQRVEMLLKSTEGEFCRTSLTASPQF
ncbi:SPX-domain-containing protein [Tilletiaria anomala UBC 951]|uniref:SPX-domain-containing protein n=1 Tax=Tilletiaria anomala (strain ATCC 24038 / CBS 436.72 / UBC 951) TaxID=1037660 RepID=A0A066VC47_TILAU|nr:SPX-domain-containing protein [Tilletiaria anomala UBC 951]KDN39317.1 SPX-domain-containing protein [Tilletiaria anomala UBC 951]